MEESLRIGNEPELMALLNERLSPEERESLLRWSKEHALAVRFNADTSDFLCHRESDILPKEELVGLVRSVGLLGFHCWSVSASRFRIDRDERGLPTICISHGRSRPVYADELTFDGTSWHSAEDD